MLAGMSPDQRELYDAEKGYNREVKKAERSLWTATKAYEARVMWAEAKLALARKHGEERLGSYTGVYGNGIELWENRVRVPKTGTKEDRWSDVTKRSLREHYFLSLRGTTSLASFSASRTTRRRLGSWRSRSTTPPDLLIPF